MKPRRTCLYMPGSNQRALEKARSIAADVLVFDLEDAVAPDAKVMAREQIKAVLEEGGYGPRELVVRINARETEWYQEDVAEMAASGAAGLLLPKTDCAADLEQLHNDLLFHTDSPPSLWAMVETPAAIINIATIADVDAPLTALVMGLEDLSKESHIPHRQDRAGFIYALSSSVMAARAAGVDIIDGVYTDIGNQEGFAAICDQGLALGFDGKSVIHPTQVAVANQTFAPAAEAVSQARELIDAWRRANSEGAGVVRHNNKLVEQLHVAQAERLIAVHEAIIAFSSANTPAE